MDASRIRYGRDGSDRFGSVVNSVVALMTGLAVPLAIVLVFIFAIAAVVGVVEAHREGSTPRFGWWAFIAIAVVGTVMTLMVFGLGHLIVWALS